MAATKIGCSEDDLIYLGRIGKLTFYIEPENWASKGFDSATSIMIHSPILIDDPIYLSKIARGVKAIMFMSEQYPECAMENFDAPKAEVEDGKYYVNGSYYDCHDSNLGVPITRERLVIMTSDLNQLVENHTMPNNAKAREEGETQAPKNNENEDVRIEEFIKDIKNKYPEATSKDIISHCFQCYSNNNNKLGPIKKIIKKIGVKYDANGGARSKKSKEYMINAPKYKPT